MIIPYYQIDAFTDCIFGGNYAGVCPLSGWLSEDLMQKIAEENNLPETAFMVARSDGGFDIRWFTPEMEMDLCGHATLASAWVLRNCLDYSESRVVFHSASGILKVFFDGDMLYMDFPSRPGEPKEPWPELAEALGVGVLELYKSRDYMAVLESEKAIQDLNPDLVRLEKLGVESLIVTAPGDSCDFVTRFFAPGMGIAEDPATGSAMCTLIPYWAERLNKSQMKAFQLSSRVGDFSCRYETDRVKIGGKGALFLTGTIQL